MYLQGVFEITKESGLTMTEIADGVSVEEVKKSTGCEVKVSMALVAACTLKYNMPLSSVCASQCVSTLFTCFACI